MKRTIEKLADLGTLLMALPRRHLTCIVGIDAPGGSGKSIFSRGLAAVLPDCTVVGMDDFFLPSTERLQGDPGNKPVGADFDWCRVYHQVLEPLCQERHGRYQRYDWVQDALAEWHEVPMGGFVVVEGLYATRHELRKSYDFTIWLECPAEIRLARGIARDGEKSRETWEKDWMIAEQLYIESHHPAKYADLIVDSSGTIQHDMLHEFIRIVKN